MGQGGGLSHEGGFSHGYRLMVSLLLPSRVSDGIKTMFNTLIDKWEDGEFLDEMDNDVIKPFINFFFLQNIIEFVPDERVISNVHVQIST